MTIVDPAMPVDARAKSAASKSAAAPTVYVCTTCRRADTPDSEPRPGALLAAATAQAAEGTEIVVCRVQCLANCSRGPSAAVRCNGSWAYIFGGLDEACAGALIDGARLLANAADGIMPWRGRPEPLKRSLIARVPPLGFADHPGKDAQTKESE